MSKKSNLFWIIIVIIAFLLGLLIGWQTGKAGLKECERKVNPLNASYTIEGEIILLDGGEYEGSKIRVSAWEDPVFGDLNADGEDDAGMLFTFSDDNNGPLYYVAAAVWDIDKNDYNGSNAIFIGDRVAPEKVTVDDGQITVDYKDRGEDDAMTVEPSVDTSRKFLVAGETLVEVK